ncbi:vanadium-dependent haloperoxidase [Maricaulis sp.]|uniref:vanadium-dependent haloperoxidase n=1 Tax=Maricaulis sp. TaxID=1486257 RepID=UPI0025C620AE|nr:vanadium-dependent haloperoxidase [Maricaulis sp.]
MKWAAAAVLGVAIAGSACADDWQDVFAWREIQSEVSQRYIEAGGQRTPAHFRSSAALDLAMFSAANAVAKRYTPYFEGLPDGATDADLAAHHAAAALLTRLYGDSARAETDARLMAVSEGHTPEARVAASRLADAVVDLTLARAGATIGDVPPYRPFTTAGRWVPTELPYFRGALNARPWVMAASSDLRPAGPPALDSELWAENFNEVMTLGALGSEVRTEEQTAEARFWVSKDWEPLVRQLAARRELDLLDTARVMALMSLATSDAGLATGEAKDHFQFWRPITAIRNADLDGREDTAVVADWAPLLNTPRHPEYPCAHCSYGAAVSAVLTASFTLEAGESVDVYAEDAPELIEAIDDLGDFSRRMSMSRLYGGVHYRFSNEDAEEIGRTAAGLALARFGQPVEAD